MVHTPHSTTCAHHPIRVVSTPGLMISTKHINVLTHLLLSASYIWISQTLEIASLSRHIEYQSVLGRAVESSVRYSSNVSVLLILFLWSKLQYMSKFLSTQDDLFDTKSVSCFQTLSLIWTHGMQKLKMLIVRVHMPLSILILSRKISRFLFSRFHCIAANISG